MLLQRIGIVLTSLSLVAIIAFGFSTFVSAQENSPIPLWIKTVVGFWVNGHASDEEFLQAIEYFVENEVIEISTRISDSEAQILESQFELLQNEINSKIEQSQNVVILPQIQKELKESNTFFTQTGNPQSVMQQIDKRWNESDPNEIDSVAYNLIHNPSGDILRSIMDSDQRSSNQFKYAEIFITNAYGANVAQSHKTTDFQQNDELWWQKAKQHGIYLSEGGHDESAGVYATDIAIKILDEDGNFIGVLKAVVNIESFNLPGKSNQSYQ